MIANLPLETGAGGREGGTIAIAETRVPVTPVTPAVGVVQRTEQREIVQPPALALLEGTERLIAPIAGPPEVRGKPIEGLAQRPALERAHRRVVHARRRANALEHGAFLGVERALPGGRPLWQVFKRDEKRIEGHRAQRRIRRALPLLHLVQGQELHEIEPRVLEVPRERDEIRNLANAPAPPRRNREERYENARVTPAAKSSGAAVIHTCAPEPGQCRRQTSRRAAAGSRR